MYSTTCKKPSQRRCRYIVAAGLLMLAFNGIAASHEAGAAHVVTNPTLDEAMQDTTVIASLMTLLGNHYAAFRSRFDQVAQPVPLKDGGLLLDGWQTDAYDTHAAVIVVLPDGGLHAAYFDSGTSEIVCFSTTGGRCHYAIAMWAKRFEVLAWRSAAPSSPEDFWAPFNQSGPNAEEQVAMRSVAASIWSKEMADNWNMNAGVGDVLGDATKHIMDCSAAFSLVPKPVGWVPGWSYVAKSAGQIVTYIIGVSGNRAYRTCVTSASRDWRSFIEWASIDL